MDLFFNISLYSTVGDEANDSKCIPFVSEYSDCTDANSCSGCHRCSCSAEGEWRCETVFDCAISDEDTAEDRETISTALDVLYSELKNKAKKKKARGLVPPPPKPEDELVVPDVSRFEEDFSTYMSRQKRSIPENMEDNKNNNTIKFFHTTDDMNEDTLKDTNSSGTIPANKVDLKTKPKLLHKNDVLDGLNKTDLNALHIEYNPQDYDRHINENKIEPVSRAQDLDDSSKSKLHKLLGNYSQSMKDDDLSKLVVNELKPGKEVIGDKNVPPMSNITFTPENDTLTAMTFIAGNLLNKLWDMEKEASDESVEVETLKHKKINDLLELFKEPLSIRQETFLKNALVKLSDTLNKNKNIKNISLCETITDSDLDNDNTHEKKLKTAENSKSKCGKERKDESVKEKIKKNIDTDVINNLNNVMSLMQKFETVQKSLGNLKHPSTFNTDLHKTNADDTLSEEENSSINLFGNLLEKITELLLPNDASKKVINKYKNLNQLNGDDNLKKALSTKLKIDLATNNITIKDKIIFDYLNHIENNPKCLLNRVNRKQKKSKINIEGDILYNLSEFFKIKSFIDLIKLTKPESITSLDTTTTTETYKQLTSPADALRVAVNKTSNNGSQKLNITKEKLKGHLKALLDDLLELQNESDPKSKSNVNILDVLPCIYNIINADKFSNEKVQDKKVDTDPLSKIKTLIDSLNLEFTSIVPTRRNDLITERPQTARILERIVTNINKQLKGTRRNLNDKVPKSYDELKFIMEAVESSGNSYKNFALLSVIPPRKRLMLLKTLEAETKQKALALISIKDSIDTLNKLSSDKRNDFKEFIDNIENNIKLSVKVLQNIGKPKENFDPTKLEAKTKTVKNSKLNDLATNYKNDVKLTKDQVLSRLIENRIKIYLQSKESTNPDFSDNISYNIAKRILSLLQQGNINLAKELFKVFIQNKPKTNKDGAATSAMDGVKQKGPLLLALKEPLIRIDESEKKIALKSPEQLFRQLLRIKNTNVQ